MRMTGGATARVKNKGDRTGSRGIFDKEGVNENGGKFMESIKDVNGQGSKVENGIIEFYTFLEEFRKFRMKTFPIGEVGYQAIVNNREDKGMTE